MVAKITFPKKLESALNYNEHKVQRGVAKCIHAANYLQDVKSLNYYQKLHGFENNNRLNNRATSKTIHISLNFDPSESIANNKLMCIADSYMDKIGFGDQPYLVYKHEDAGHPHIHIVSSTIRNDGCRINTHNIGRNQSEKARKEIEQTYSLVQAENQSRKYGASIKPIDIKLPPYGTVETKRTISNIVTEVYNNYKFSSLPEFNAALSQFNLLADRGKEGGRIFNNGGLLYHMLDRDKKMIGVPIKASKIGCKPILANLKKKFSQNNPGKVALKLETMKSIDKCMLSAGNNMPNLISSLATEKIYLLVRKNGAGLVYGVTFVDNKQKVVFNGSQLGKNYSAAAFQNYLFEIGRTIDKKNSKENSSGSLSLNKQFGQYSSIEKKTNLASNRDDLVNALFSVKDQQDFTPSGLIKKKRKKKRKNNDL